VWTDDDFADIGVAFAAATGLERVANVGAGEARLMPIRALVDFGVQWMEANRR
jgi:aminoglycoside 3-N-acetyltransferase